MLAEKRLPTRQVLQRMLARLKGWEEERDGDPATSYLYDESLDPHVRQVYIYIYIYIYILFIGIKYAV